MNELVKQRPDRWRWLGEQRFTWPVNVSLHPHDIKGMERGAAIRDFLETALQLGARSPIRFAPQTHLSGPDTRAAVQLFVQVEDARIVPRKEDRRDAKNLACDTGWRRGAQLLGEPVKANAPHWWKVAEQALKEKSPSPALAGDKELRRLVVGAASTKAYYDSEIHSKIVSKIKRSFLKLFHK